jgi:hypothetical protein
VHNALGLTAYVLGFVGFVLGFVPILYVGALSCATLALALGTFVRRRLLEKSALKHDAAGTAIIFGTAGVVLGIVGMLFATGGSGPALPAG